MQVSFSNHLQNKSQPAFSAFIINEPARCYLQQSKVDQIHYLQAAGKIADISKLLGGDIVIDMERLCNRPDFYFQPKKTKDAKKAPKAIKAEIGINRDATAANIVLHGLEFASTLLEKEFKKVRAQLNKLKKAE